MTRARKGRIGWWRGGREGWSGDIERRRASRRSVRASRPPATAPVTTWATLPVCLTHSFLSWSLVFFSFVLPVLLSVLVPASSICHSHRPPEIRSRNQPPSNETERTQHADRSRARLGAPVLLSQLQGPAGHRRWVSLTSLVYVPSPSGSPKLAKIGNWLP